MLSTSRVPIILIFLFGFVLLALSGCSSSDSLSAGSTVSSPPADAVNFKVTITSSNNAGQPETQIEFSLRETGPVFIEITNATGYHVRTLYDDVMEVGAHWVVWDGINENGDEVDPSIYLFHIEASSHEAWYPFAWIIMPNNLQN